MKKKTISREQKVKDWVSDLVPIIAQEYGLGKIAFYYRFSDREGRGHSSSALGRGTVVFQIGYDAPYRSAYITIYPKAIELFEAKQFGPLLNGITHEVAHIITGPMVDVAYERHSTERELTEQNESLTEAVAQLGRKILINSRPKIFGALASDIKELN